MRVLTWNCRRATRQSPLWNYFRELAPDVALLQEVNSIPQDIEEAFDIQFKRATGKKDKLQIFGSAILVKGKVEHAVPLTSKYNWVNEELARFGGNIIAARVSVQNIYRLNVVNVYSPAWPINRERLRHIDVSTVKLLLNADVWVADLLWSSLHSLKETTDHPWVVAGDFNLSETFDAWKGGPRGNREYLDRMSALGLTEGLRHKKGQLTPTFRNPRGGSIKHQMDHLFMTEDLATCLMSCETGNQGRVFTQSLSDHLPIVADFDLKRPNCAE